MSPHDITDPDEATPDTFCNVDKQRIMASHIWTFDVYLEMNLIDFPRIEGMEF